MPCICRALSYSDTDFYFTSLAGERCRSQCDVGFLDGAPHPPHKFPERPTQSARFSANTAPKAIWSVTSQACFQYAFVISRVARKARWGRSRGQNCGLGSHQTWQISAL